MPRIFFYLNVPGLLIHPYVIIDREYILLCLHSFIKMDVLFFLAEKLHDVTGFPVHPGLVTPFFQLFFQYGGVGKLQHQVGDINDQRAKTNSDEQAHHEPDVMYLDRC